MTGSARLSISSPVLDHGRNELKRRGITAFKAEQLERFSQRYEELIAAGYEANQTTKGRLAKKKDLRICKNRDKMAGGFRSSSGREMYCRIMSFIETVKRRGLNIYQSIMAHTI